MDLGHDSENYQPDEGSYDSVFMDLDAVFQARRSGRKQAPLIPPGSTLVSTEGSSPVHSDGQTAVRANLQRSKFNTPFAQSLNERPSGVRSNYDENIYTTTINRRNPQYAEQAARAEKLAREIERGSALDVNVDQDVVGDPVKNTTGNQETSVRSDVEETYVTGYGNVPNAYRSYPVTGAPHPHQIGRFACAKCGKLFYQIKRLREHEKTHSKPHKCRFCDKSFETINDRDYHEKPHRKLYRPQQEERTKENQSYNTQSMASLSGLATSPVSLASRLQGEAHITYPSSRRPQPIRSGINAKTMHEYQQSSAIAPSQQIEELGNDTRMRMMSSPSHSSPQKVRKALGSKSRIGYESVDDYKSPSSPASSIDSMEFSPEAGEYVLDGIPEMQDRAFSNDQEETGSGRIYPYPVQHPYNSSQVSEDESKSAAMAAPLMKTTTDQVCKYFIEAVENQEYDWFWKCPRWGDNCIYKHSLPPGFVLKTKEQRETEKALMESSPLVKLEQISCEAFDILETESRSVEMATPILIGDTPDLPTGIPKQDNESQATIADKEFENSLSNSDNDDISVPVVQLPFSGHELDLMAVTKQGDTSESAFNTASHPLITVYNPIGLWKGVKIVEFFNVISRGFDQAVHPAKFAATILGLRESPIPPNSRRIRWTCTCGMSLYDDFIELVPGGLDDLQRKLDTENLRRQHTNSNQGSSNHSSSGLGSLLSILGRIPLIRKHMNGKTTGAGQLPTYNSSSTTTVAAGTARSLYLLLCMKSGIFGTDLHHGQLQHVNCDRDLLTLLRTAYNKRRSKLRSAISFRIINRISFVKFVADMNSNVDIHPHSIYCGKTDCICLPPKCKVEPEPNSEYSCNPIPARHIPPVGENYLMHLFSSPECIHPSQVWILNQIPKRTCGQLIARPDAPAEGWGLHFQEGWHWMKTMTVILTLFVGGSLVFGLVYAVLRKDVQTAFTAATYWFTASGVLLGYLAARSP